MDVKNLIADDLVNHEVRVTLPGGKEEQTLYLIEMTSRTSKLADFTKAYQGQATETHLKIAKKIFGGEKMDNVYGVLFSQERETRMVFAFNREFADYDKERKEIVYKDIDDLLMGYIDPATPDFSKPNFFHTEHPMFPKGGTSGVLKYSLVEKT